MMENDYMFLSEVTKACLPFGVSHLSELKREDISLILKNMEGSAKKTNWVDMFFYSRVNCLVAWEEDAILNRLKDLRSDIGHLKGKLKT